MTVSLIRVRSLTWATVRPARWRAPAKAAPIDTLRLHSSSAPRTAPAARRRVDPSPHHVTRFPPGIGCLVLFAALSVPQSLVSLCVAAYRPLERPSDSASHGETWELAPPQLHHCSDYLANVVVRGGVEPPAF